MPRKRTKATPSKPCSSKKAKATAEFRSLDQEYEEACSLAEAGKLAEARIRLELLHKAATEKALQARLRNDLGVLAFLEGDHAAAREAWQAAGSLDSGCASAKSNLAVLDAETSRHKPSLILSQGSAQRLPSKPTPVRVAILSFLFNWPTTGGGNVHTYELAIFLQRAGYEVKHWYVKHPDWGIGDVPEPLPYPCEGLEFCQDSWNAKGIQARFRLEVDRFNPDHVILTDSWSFKPLLAEAVAGFPYILRFQAMECLCPLNNIRLLPSEGDGVRQCTLHQLATPAECVSCIDRFGQGSGSLHQVERALSGVGTPEYHEKLVRAFRDAEAVLVVNPLTEAMMSPYTKTVRVATAGMDPDRFPWPSPQPGRSDGRVRFFFAGLVQEPMKGFDVLHRACAILWKKRQDFELVATGDPAGSIDSFTRFVGWKSQQELPSAMRETDVLVMPTIAQEALGRTAVEALGAGKPVIASRLGGLPYTVADGATGLLCEPGNAEDLAAKMEVMLDEPELRKRMGLAGRKRFEEHYAWPVIIDRHYKPILDKRRSEPAKTSYQPALAEHVDLGRLSREIATFLEVDVSHVQSKLNAYRSFHDAKGYAQSLGERKTLCFEEALLFYILLGKLRPKTIVEIGTQHGKSARRLLDMMALLGLDARLICFDVENQVQHFHPHEAELRVCDVTGSFKTTVLEALAPDLIFVDVHTYFLLKEIIQETLSYPKPVTLAIHDCTAGLCNPKMTLAKEDVNVTSFTGIWERHVLAEAFGIADPLSPKLNELETTTHRWRIFSTPHGLGVLRPKR